MNPYQESDEIDGSRDITRKPPKAYHNSDFIGSVAARHIRVQCELLEPYYRFRGEHVNHTIVFFESARIQPRDVIEQKLELARRTGTGAHTPDMSEEIEALEKELTVSRYYEDARRMAKQLTEWSDATFPKEEDRYYISSGGGPGIMEAANRGAKEAGGRSIGLGISLPFEASNNPYITPDLSFEFHYFFVRKYWFLYPAKAIVIFPGGFGTMDEFFEVVTLIQTQKIRKKMPIVLYGHDYWDGLINFEKFKDLGLISPEDLDLFKIIDDVDEAQEYIIRKIADYKINDQDSVK
ncbi:MAG: LOG family protein [Opitutales bacterium]|nr:LOG family protein [Opitutales bacterium]